MASKKTKVGLEIGAAILAAAGAGYYFYASKNAMKHRSAATSWAKGLKMNALKEAKKMKKWDQKTVGKAVDMAVAAYATAKSVNKVELKQAVTELKKNWKALSSEAQGTANTSKKLVKGAMKSGKKVVKAVAKGKSAMKKPARSQSK